MGGVWTPVGGARAFGQAGANIQVELLRYAAAERGIATEVIEGEFWRASLAGITHTFAGAVPDTLTVVARRAADSKQVTRTLLAEAGLPVPRGQAFDRADRAAGWRYATELGLPVVVKPIRGNGGKGVTPGISTEALFDLAWEAASGEPQIVVEEMVGGLDYRLLVVGDRMVLASWRRRAALVGDGTSTLAQLVEQRNAARADNPVFSRKPIALSAVMLHNLALKGLGHNSVLTKGLRVILTLTANTALGGANLDVTDRVHPGFAEIAIRARAAIPGTVHVGVDLLAADISRSPAEQDYAICEVNAQPDLAFHHLPIEGPARDAAGALIEGLFPGATPVPPEQWRRASLEASECPPGAAQALWKLAALHAVAGHIRASGAHRLAAELCGPPPAVAHVLAEFARAYPGIALTAANSLRPAVSLLEASGFSP